MLRFLVRRLLDASFHFLAVHIHMGGIFALVIKIVGEYGGIAPFDGDVVSVHGLIHHKQVGICHGIFGG